MLRRWAAPGASAASLASPALPVDHLAPAELLEGTEKALGVLLPRGLKVDESFGSVVYTSGPLAVHPLVQYFRARLKNGDLHEGPSSATFETRHGAGPEPGLAPHGPHRAAPRRRAGRGLRDETPPPAPKLPDVAARWKNVGLTPNGRLARIRRTSTDACGALAEEKAILSVDKTALHERRGSTTEACRSAFARVGPLARRSCGSTFTRHEP